LELLGFDGIRLLDLGFRNADFGFLNRIIFYFILRLKKKVDDRGQRFKVQGSRGMAIWSEL